jgi:hypothetical protein
MAKKTPTQSTKKSTAEKPKAAAAEPRALKASKYNSFKLQKKITPAQLGPKLPSAFRVFRDSLRVLTERPKLFLGMLFWYGLVNIVFIQGLSAGGDITSTKTALDTTFQGGAGHIWSGLGSFAYLLSTSTSSSSGSSTGLFQFIWVIIVSLAFIWTLRQVHARQKVRIRDGFYQGVYPLIPVMLVLIVIGIESIPFIIGGSVFSAVINNGIATSAVQLFVWGLGFFALTAVSVYLICSSFFALYIACLPDVAPAQALRSARQLVAARRWTVLRKILFLPLVLGLMNVVVMLPIIIGVPAIATWAFAVVSMFNLAIAHSYYYSLYRSLL